ncbi:2-oxo acid dehydrogenase subunit E2 [Virgibacillus dakarensis]|uniref:Dihydrolipoamide acetyltransferase component of pyruvate dehydrogenase complex n=1 Tax=Lentibacillus populi TaxID=1827502 RepID=A0A9W5TWP4_9BACI|nr:MULTISPECIES: dihydrolipoamide acetyltransferase family protein [Bacillaceae]MBT2217284.1 2-oxo acid dehydrogenase subunit E2 [Virgibacillus dakarensis]MTW86781.1 2-oxo acid dehydrogenase subunit E2 [Virgibacillus dakarensis]GGB38306.1 dihydrolipoamide acetyltransferase component of pyruvate dehydrogenase complex [Lentibacillus populi]
MATSIVMPKLGMTMTEGTVVEWLKNPGDPITEGEGVVTISSEKLTNEVEAPASGILLEIKKEVDDEASVGEVIGIIGEKGEKVDTITSASEQIHEDDGEQVKQQKTPASAAGQPDQQVGDSSKKRLRISPAARKKAKALGVDTLQVTGTGPNSRITRRDIEQAAKKAAVQPIEQTDQKQSTASDANIANMSQMRSTIANRMHESLTATAQLTLHRKADINRLLDFQKKLRQEARENDLDLKLTLTVLLARAVTLSLKDNPLMNTHLIDNKLHQYDEVDLGIATALEEGLVVPVVKHAERLPLGDLAKSIQTVTEKARNGTNNELSGSTFTITNLGNQGVEYFTPILNTPESGILGVGTFVDELKLEEEKVISVKKLPLSLTFDHRVLDGAPAAAFLSRIVYYLENPYLLVL